MSLSQRRVGLLFAVFMIAFGGVVARAAWLQAVRGGDLSADASEQQTRTITLPGIRGSILDAKGKPLAISEEAATVVATPYQVEKPEQTAAKLAKILKGNEEEIFRSLVADTGFEYIARAAPLDQVEKIRKLELPGIGSYPDARRVYPQDQLAGLLIGDVNLEGDGAFGLEAAEQDRLAASDGERLVTSDALGDELGRDTLTGAERGTDIGLTIDATIQRATEEALAELGETNGPDGATAIAMDPDDGSILAMATWPSAPRDLSEAAPEDLLNMATGFTYEPGSTFKAFTVAGALEDGAVTPETPFALPDVLNVADREITESHPVGPRTLTVADILRVSSNIGAVQIGLTLNKGSFGGRFDRWIHRFGFDAPTGIELPGEERGIVPTPENYSGSTMGNLPLGQGLAVTPLQMMAGYAAIANGGTLRTPRLIDEIDGEKIPLEKGKQVISAETASQVRTMLAGVIGPDGTADIAVDGYELAGKTGTAEKAIEGGYSETDVVASFVGFAPASHPEFLMAVIVDTPDPLLGGTFGGEVAAPVFEEIASSALPYLGVRPE